MNYKNDIRRWAKKLGVEVQFSDCPYADFVGATMKWGGASIEFEIIMDETMDGEYVPHVLLDDYDNIMELSAEINSETENFAHILVRFSETDKVYIVFSDYFEKHEYDILNENTFKLVVETIRNKDKLFGSPELDSELTINFHDAAGVHTWLYVISEWNAFYKSSSDFQREIVLYFADEIKEGKYSKLKHPYYNIKNVDDGKDLGTFYDDNGIDDYCGWCWIKYLKTNGVLK